jgi:hypothetical protein
VIGTHHCHLPSPNMGHSTHVWYGFIYLCTFSSNTINSLWPTKVTLALNMIDVDENCCIIFITTLYFPSDSLDFRNSNGNILTIDDHSKANEHFICLQEDRFAIVA